MTEFIVSCQTYEGGFSSLPGLESHGGYTFCALAALFLLDKMNNANLDRLKDWTMSRQMQIEGGYQGRTNKLVDGCYSYWVGALLPIIHMHDKKTKTNETKKKVTDYMDREKLELFLLGSCQGPKGGLRDKPGKLDSFDLSF